MKKQTLAQDALTLYAEKFMTLDKIAKQLNMSERMLRRWKKANNWDDIKYRFIKNQTLFHEDLFKFGQTLLESIKNDWALGEKSSRHGCTLRLKFLICSKLSNPMRKIFQKKNAKCLKQSQKV